MDKENVDNNSPDIVPSSQGSHLELVQSSQGSPLVSCTQHLDLRLEDATEETTLDSQYTQENLAENVTEDMPELGNSPSESDSQAERRAEKRAAETELTELDGPKKQIKIEENEEVMLTIDNSDVEILETEINRPKKSIEIVTINDSLNQSPINISSNTFEEQKNDEQPEEDDDNENKSATKDLDFNKSKSINISKSRDDTFEDEKETHISTIDVETPKTSNDTLEFEQPKSANASMSSLKLSQSQNSSVS